MVSHKDCTILGVIETNLLGNQESYSVSGNRIQLQYSSAIKLSRYIDIVAYWPTRETEELSSDQFLKEFESLNWLSVCSSFSSLFC